MGEVSRLPGLFDGCFVRGNGSDLPRHDWDYEKEKLWPRPIQQATRNTVKIRQMMLLDEMIDKL
jgi:hypothetical protein